MNQDRNRIEQLLERAFCQVLEQEDIGPDDDFFLLGGHSFLVVRLSRMLAQEGLRIDFEMVFDGRTIRGVTDLLCDSAPTGRPR